MNVLMAFCAYACVIYLPFDFFLKPVAEDHEAWFGILLTGWAAKATEPLHWAIYGFGWYGFWRMRSWMWPWASLYVAQVALGMIVWGAYYRGGTAGFALGLLAAAPLALAARALWDARPLFEDRATDLHERYGGGWAVITGASAGIGAEYARALARQGFDCVLVARRADKLEALSGELETTQGIKCRIETCDLASEVETNALADRLSDLDVSLLVNNAGAGYAGPFIDQDPARLAAMVRLNCVAPVVLTSRLLPALAKRERSGIIVVGSLAGRQPIPFQGTYAATKAFDLLFGEALAVELADRGVDVQVIQPGPVTTEFEQVAGERRVDPELDQSPFDVVRVSLDNLGIAASISSSWRVHFLALVSRFLPRSLTALIGASMMERQLVDRPD